MVQMAAKKNPSHVEIPATDKTHNQTAITRRARELWMVELGASRSLKNVLTFT